MFRVSAAVALFIALLIGADIAAACSRVLWNDNGQAVVGRNMDWPQDMQTNLWAFPRGIARSGLSSGNSLNWISKYGSGAASVYDIAIADGINEKGLVANLLWLAESDYGPRSAKRAGLSLSLWAQYMLANFATVAEAIAASEHGGFQIVPLAMPGSDSAATVHLSLANASGDSAVVEIVDGVKVRIHHGRQYTVMTNSPPFPQQLANLKQYEGLAARRRCPARPKRPTVSCAAPIICRILIKAQDVRQTVAEIFSVMRNVAQPFVKPSPTRPYVSHTIWRTVADATDRLYFYESTLSPNVIWVRLDALERSAGAPVRRLDLLHQSDLVGDVSGSFEPNAPLSFKLAGE